MDIRFNGVRHEAVLELGGPKRAPHDGQIRLGRVLSGPLHVADVVDEHPHGLLVVVEFFVRREGLLVHIVLNGDFPDDDAVKVIQAVDVVHDAMACTLRLDGGDE